MTTKKYTLLELMQTALKLTENNLSMSVYEFLLKLDDIEKIEKAQDDEDPNEGDRGSAYDQEGDYS